MATMELEDNEGRRIPFPSDQSFPPDKQFKSVTIRLGCSTIELTSGENGCVDVKIRGASYTCPNCSTQHTVAARSTGNDPSEADSSSPGQLSATTVPAQHNDSGGKVNQVQQGPPRANKDDKESTEAWNKDVTGFFVSVSSAVISSTFNGAVHFRKLPRWGNDSPAEELYIIFDGLAFYISIFTILLLFSGRTAPGTWKFIALNFCVALQLTNMAIVICAALFKSLTAIVVPNIIIWVLFLLLWLHRSLGPRARWFLFWKRRVEPTAVS